MTNLENNKLIAEFMRMDIAFDGTFSINPMTKYGCWEKMKYNSNWDWLMAVVEKIQLSKYTDEFDIFWDSIDKINGCTILPAFKNTFSIIQFTSSNKKEAVYNSCVEFIKWYNINNK